jgi:hypothetical protein
MRRAREAFLAWWGAGKWLWTFLAGGGVIAASALVAGLPGRTEIISGVAAVFLYLLFAGCSQLGLAVVDSRIEHEEESDFPPTSSLKFLYSLQAGQVVLLLLTVIALFTFYVSTLVDAATADEGLDAQLADRVDALASAIWEADADKIEAAQRRIAAFCVEHSDDDKANNIFMETCDSSTMTPPPSRDELADLLERLKK